MKLIVLRTHYTDKYTQGVMLINDKFFGYTLEDPVRFTQKIRTATAIPAGYYHIGVTHSYRFGRWLPEIFNVNNFIGVRIHGGNRHTDTEGCILVAKNKGEGVIWGSLAGKLTATLKKTMGNKIEIINTREW